MLSQLAVIPRSSKFLPRSTPPGTRADLGAVSQELGETLHNDISFLNAQRSDSSCVPPAIPTLITPASPHLIRRFPVSEFTLENLSKPGPTTSSLNASGQGVLAAERIAIELPDREIATEPITLSNYRWHDQDFSFEQTLPVQKEADA